VIYLDHNATTQLWPEVRAQMASADEVFGNPSSLHAAGRAARELVEQARREVAQLVGALPEEVVFTSSGTEADQLAIPRAGHVVVSAIEHPAVMGARGDATVVDVAPEGFVDPEAFERALRSDTVLASIQLANHETGTLQPIAQLAKIARERGVAFHTDAVQAAGKIPIDMRSLGVDSLSLSAHKIGGPKGIGALLVRRGAKFEPLLRGHQERERRGGTENVAGIVGFGAAAALARKNLAAWSAHTAALRDRFEQGALALSARRHGAMAPRVPNTSNVAWEGISGELLTINLDLEGVCVSTGAACTSGSLKPSPVLLALGLPKARALEAVRVSVGPENTAEEIDRVLELLPELIARIRRAG
jgi:cysteine desulfurase